MDTEIARKSLLLFYDAVNRHDPDGFDALVTEGFVDHEVPQGFPAGIEGVKQFMGAFMAAFPDLHFEPLDIAVENHNICARVRMTGTHQGELQGIAATGKSVDLEFCDWVKFDDEGRALEHWGYVDNLRLLQQLGVIPESP
jgi:predicted ester cyclase